jgi:hypothetical protein
MTTEDIILNIFCLVDDNLPHKTGNRIFNPILGTCQPPR